MTRQVRQFVAFVASPGDLQQERDAVRLAAQGVNDAIGRRFGLSIVVEGWEEVQPALGRPQALINPRVDDCDIFIGLLNRRWGMPTGTHSSGFEEEYQRALTRARSGSGPTIALFFRRLSAEETVDAGPQLEQVLAFQARVREERVALYQTFGNADDLRFKLFALLSDFLAERAATTLRPPAAADSPASAAGETSPAAVAEATETDSTADVDAARLQVGDVLQSWADVVCGKPTSGPLDSDRLLSFAIAMGQDGDPLPTHPANRLYLQREALHLSAGEGRSWLRAICEEAGRVPDGVWGRYVPGWFFFAHHDDLPLSLLQFAKEDVWLRARGAVILMTTLRARPAALWQPVGRRSAPGEVPIKGDDASPDTPVAIANWTALLSNESTARPALQYLHDVATSNDSPLLAQITSAAKNHPWEEVVSTVVASVRGDRLPALDYLLEHPYDSADWIAADVASVIPDADTERVIAVIHGRHTRDVLRVRAFDELLARGALDEGTGPGVVAVMLRRSDTTRNHLLDRPYQGVDESLREWLRRGWFSLREDERRFGAKERVNALTRSSEELSATPPEGLAGLEAWQALSVQGGSDLVSRAREVLRSGGTEFGANLSGDGDRDAELRTFAAALGRAAALRVLASAPVHAREPGDVELARAEVANADAVTRPAALNALATLAEPRDLPTLLEAVSETAPLEATSEVLNRILELGEAEAAHLLARAENSEVAAAGARALASDPAVSDGELIEMLYDEKGDVRRAAFEGLAARLDEPRLKALLDSYPAKPGRHYYYDVITALDWHLFEPKAESDVPATRMPLNES